MYIQIFSIGLSLAQVVFQKMCAEPRNLSSPQYIKGHTLNKHFVTSHLSIV